MMFSAVKKKRCFISKKHGMSYYQFSGPVQGGGFGPDDEERRRRRKHHRDAGAPFSSIGVRQMEPLVATPSAPPSGYTGLGLGAGAGVQPGRRPASEQQVGHVLQQAAAPRQQAAIDMGQGAQQVPQSQYSGREYEEMMEAGRGWKSKTPQMPALEAAETAGRPPDTSSFGDVATEKTPREHVIRIRPSSRPSDAAARARDHQADLRGPRRVRFQDEPGPDPRVPAFDPHEDAGYGPVRGRQRNPLDAWYDDPVLRDAYFGLEGSGKAHEWAARHEQDEKFVIPGAAAIRAATVGGSPAPTRTTPHRPPKPPPNYSIFDPQPPQADKGPLVPGKPTPTPGPPGPPTPTPKPAAKDELGAEWRRDFKGSIVEQERLKRELQQTKEQAGRERQRGLTGRNRARLEHQRIMRLKNEANKRLIDQLGYHHAAVHQLAEVKKQDLGKLRSAAWDEMHHRERAEVEKAAVVRARHAGELGKEKVRTASVQSELGRQKAWAEQEIGTGVALVASQDRQIEALRLRAMKREKDLLKEGNDLLKRGHNLAAEGNRRLKLAADHVADLQNKIQTGDATAASLRDAIKRAQDELDAARKALAESAHSKELSAAEKASLQDEMRRLKDDLAHTKRLAQQPARAAPAQPPAAAPRAAPAAPAIVVQGGAGGGGASAAGGAASSSGGGGRAPAAAAPDLSKVVEAIKQMSAEAKKKSGGGTKGITRARRTYTDKRKAKIAELRALKSKRIREFATKTKKLPKAERQKQRREYKKRVEAQFKEMQTRFPTARGLKSVGVIRELIRKIEAFRAAK